MKIRTSLLAALSLIAAFAAQPALASDRGRDHDRRWDDHRPRHAQTRVIYRDYRPNYRPRYYNAHGGNWVHARHGSRNGWWFVVGNSWFPFADPYQQPTIVTREKTIVIYDQDRVPMAATPIAPVYQSADDGRYCREFQSTIRIGGKPQPAYGTACRMPDGSWEVAS